MPDIHTIARAILAYIVFIFALSVTVYVVVAAYYDARKDHKDKDDRNVTNYSLLLPDAMFQLIRDGLNVPGALEPLAVCPECRRPLEEGVCSVHARIDQGAIMWVQPNAANYNPPKEGFYRHED